jgi:hypothetical protein
VCFDEALKQPVSEDQQFFAPVQRLTERQQLDRHADRFHHPVHRRVEAFRRVERKRDGVSRDPFVDRNVRGVAVGHGLILPRRRPS